MPQRLFFFSSLLNICVCVQAKWRLILSYPVVSRDQTQLARCGPKCLYPFSDWAGPLLCLNCKVSYSWEKELKRGIIRLSNWELFMIYTLWRPVWIVSIFLRLSAYADKRVLVFKNPYRSDLIHRKLHVGYMCRLSFPTTVSHVKFVPAQAFCKC